MYEKDVLSLYQVQWLQVRTTGICILFLKDIQLFFSIFADFRIPSSCLNCARSSALFSLPQLKKTKHLFIFLGLTEHVYSNFPFVTSVGDRCFEEKHVFIASKTLGECSLQTKSNWHRTDFNHSCMILFRLNWIALLFILFCMYFDIIFLFFFSTRYKCHKECMPNAPPNCGFSEVKLRRVIDNTDIQIALGKRWISMHRLVRFIFPLVLANSSPLSRKYPSPRTYWMKLCIYNVDFC